MTTGQHVGVISDELPRRRFPVLRAADVCTVQIRCAGAIASASGHEGLCGGN